MRRPLAQLPGIRFEAVEPPVGDDLPRMDVAVFVGFAAAGPLHLPVAIEDAAEFAGIFGGDLPLARDQVTGAFAFAYLSRAVRAFFRNGGRRCWVIRVADETTACTNRFAIPKLSRLNADGSLVPALAEARSPGSWSDSLQIETDLQCQVIEISDKAAIDSPSRLELKLPGPRDLAAGDLLRLTFGSETSPVLQERVGCLCAIDSIGSTSETQSPIGSPLTDATGAIFARGTAWWFRLGAAGSPLDPADQERTSRLPGEQWRRATPALFTPSNLPASPLVGAERLTFDLIVRFADAPTRPPARLSGLGFAPGHPRYWASLPSDTAFFLPIGEPTTKEDKSAGNTAPPTALWSEVAQPRFPLRGEQRVLPAHYLPIDTLSGATMPSCVMGSDSRNPSVIDRATATPLERDGLARFSADLFLDPQLAEVGVDRLLSEGAFIRYEQQATRRLRGVHAALLGLEEVSLIAVPDAVHRGWQVEWRAPVVEATEVPQPPPSLVSCIPELPVPGSEEPFVDCGVLPAPRLSVVTVAPEGAFGQTASYDATWSAVLATAVRYELQEATRDDFWDAMPPVVTSDTSLAIIGKTSGAYFYRVRAVTEATASPWSNVIRVRVEIPDPATLIAEADYDFSGLERVHRGLLALCAARGDLLAVLALPDHAREADASAHVDRLVTQTLERTLSFGALYHPWLVGRAGDLASEPHATPPDGTVCGLIARRTLARGAWIAPANEPLNDVLALTPLLDPARRLDLQEAGVNVVRKEPRGFLLLSADTLSRDDEVRPVNVRRLLILLRRLALRRGARYVFEPNDAVFRRTVQRGFEATLDDLFVRGAFAGSTPEGAYQVKTGPDINTPQSVDLGRFIVELRVAPSRPLTFLTVRLVQIGDRPLAVVER